MTSTLPRIVFSVAEDYFDAAAQELRAAFAKTWIERLGPDAGGFEAVGVEIAAVAEVCRRRPLVFVRHLLMQERVFTSFSGRRDDLDRVAAFALELFPPSRRPAVSPSLQVWTSGAAPTDYRPDELRHHVADRLQEAGIAVARAGRDEILSICLTPKGIILGLNPRSDALADWPGGRVSLARDPGQISRAEFKLEELFKLFDVPVPADGIALDLGASPGGWTRVLRRHGLDVWAIDPANLDPRLASDPAVHHIRTTAGRFLTETRRHFDLVVNDMRMDALLSCEVMHSAAAHLNPGGLAIMTLKLSPHAPLATVHRCLSALARRYEILHARQLHHNRNEITVVARRRDVTK